MQSIRLLFFLLLALGAPFGALAEPEQTDAEQQSSSEVVWIDVRSWLENQLDSIDGDLNIPVSGVLDGVTEQFPDKNTPIRLYCASGGRSGKALDQLIDAGYSDVENVGGIADVRKLRFPPEKTPEETSGEPKLAD